MNEALNHRNRLNEIIDVHKGLELDERYEDCEMSWIALERSDTYEDWGTFKKIYEKSPEVFLDHIMKTWILNYNILKKVRINMDRVNSWTDFYQLQELSKTRINDFLSNK